jgi:2-dehydro-3-deoxy-D-arabinonate dehydratase
MTIKLCNSADGPVATTGRGNFRIDADWDDLLNDDDLGKRLAAICDSATPVDPTPAPRAPIGTQEVWAAGVTYYRSRLARIEEASNAGGGDFYDRVYAAPRPEIFFKATPDRVVGPGESMCLRADSKWIVPEPELTLVVTRNRKIIGYTVGNDLSCRDIEGENPLYLPQAKTFDRCAALGPVILVTESALPASTMIRLRITRSGSTVVAAETSLAEMKRDPFELVDYLFRDNAHPRGCFLMTGTGIVPDDDFSLADGDVVDITIDGIGTLSNPMAGSGHGR